MVWGRLYDLHAGFRALEVPKGLILARATADPLADARRQQEIGAPRFGRPTGDWDLIHGGLVTFTICRPSIGWKDFGPAGTACISG